MTQAPEILLGKTGYDVKADIWSLGCIFYELLVGKTPFDAKNMDELCSKLKNGKYLIPKNIKLSLPGVDLLERLLQKDPEKRLSWSYLQQHPYLKSDQFTIDQ